MPDDSNRLVVHESKVQGLELSLRHIHRLHKCISTLVYSFILAYNEIDRHTPRSNVAPVYLPLRISANKPSQSRTLADISRLLTPTTY